MSMILVFLCSLPTDVHVIKMFIGHVIRQVNFDVAVIYVFFFLKRGETLACNHMYYKNLSYQVLSL
jgi:hypothetical protein